jgi:hypothetical protein
MSLTHLKILPQTHFSNSRTHGFRKEVNIVHWELKDPDTGQVIVEGEYLEVVANGRCLPSALPVNCWIPWQPSCCDFPGAPCH